MYIVRETFDCIFDTLDIPRVHYQSMREFFLSSNFKVRYTIKVGRQEYVMMSFLVAGTTLSGHPFTTTFGNTNRATLYLLYVLAGMRPIKNHKSIAGDDNFLIIERVDFRDF